jgi:putative hydrolase of the HAD superfamily
MTPAAVLFDFSATLFDPARVVDAAAFAEHARRRGQPLADADAGRLAGRIQQHADSAAGRRARAGCDLSAAGHRAGWLAVAEQVQGVDAGVAEAFHDCITDPLRWEPYADTGPALRSLRRQGVRIGIVSNCGWDVRRAFRRAALADLVDTYALSFEHGCEKPDPALFRLALDDLGAEPAHTVMVGDDPLTDSGALAAGIAVHLLPVPAPHPAERGLLRLLRHVFPAP